MIQELLGEASTTGVLIGQDIIRSKFAVPAAGVSPSSSSTTATTTTTTIAPSPTASSSTASENLRCPRCDSTNTKFCYYNNYNLTQPRHFCKTCRRYWTKGGALRNVPIGGGCRKNKGLTTSSSSAASYNNKSNNNNNHNHDNTIAKLKTTISSELGIRSSFISSSNSSSFVDHDLISSNPILFPSPQNSHLLSLLRTNPTNPNSNPNSTTIKDEPPVLFQSNLSCGVPPARILGLDPLGPFSSVWRSSSNQQQNGAVVNVGELQQNSSAGILDFYQRLRSSTTLTNNYYQDNAAPPAASSSTSTSTILESAPVVGGGATATELGFWTNPILSWSDLPTTHGSYP